MLDIEDDLQQLISLYLLSHCPISHHRYSKNNNQQPAVELK